LHQIVLQENIMGAENPFSPNKVRLGITIEIVFTADIRKHETEALAEARCGLEHCYIIWRQASC
jgi:hypothetical protein